MQKVKDIVTPGGEFTDGLRVIKSGRIICNFFTGYPQRKKKLGGVVECYDLPSIMVTNYPDTRVAFASKFFGTLLANHYAFKLVGHEDFAKVFNKLAPKGYSVPDEIGRASGTEYILLRA